MTKSHTAKNNSTPGRSSLTPLKLAQCLNVGENLGTSMEARDFKIVTELPEDMHTTFLT